MSIILRALKKIQEEKAKETSLAPREDAEGNEIGVDSDALSAALPVSADTEPDSGGAPVDGVSAGREAAAFGSGPKLLLAAVLILGVFTTGWFTSRIYLSVNPTRKTEASEAQAEIRPPAVASTTRAPALKPAPVPTSDHIETEPVSPAGAPAAQQPEKPPTSADEGTPPKAEMTATEAKPPSQPSPETMEAKPEKKGRPELKINAIAWRSEEPKAIVNMQRVYEGDVIEGATVLAIEKRSILFKYEGEIFEVRF